MPFGLPGTLSSSDGSDLFALRPGGRRLAEHPVEGLDHPGVAGVAAGSSSRVDALQHLLIGEADVHLLPVICHAEIVAPLLAASRSASIIGMTTNRIPVTTLSNLGAAFTEETTEVWCDCANSEAATNFDGRSHFCQFCGSTEHEELGPSVHVSETPSSVA